MHVCLVLLVGGEWTEFDHELYVQVCKQHPRLHGLGTISSNSSVIGTVKRVGSKAPPAQVEDGLSQGELERQGILGLD